MLLADEEGFSRVLGLQHDVAAASKDVSDEDAHLVVVLDEQDRLVALRRLRG
jgi:hypothetical protein